ncbi:hypothetical protein OESDEN_19886 [Oesophagostomum dentatum]|uniref:protein-disulfide reductase n=1 Tax=Oesophagostomum dentatum TaxID=61180 RepID=A0A0B1SB25_OESDE|nr:hypothetical protein OESDEN_19886 [Oesophagostomum dentatum]
MFGSVEQFTAIINPPQAAILAVGGTRAELDDNFKPHNKFTATLCYDARAITETSAQRFLDHFAASLSDPDFMMLLMYFSAGWCRSCRMFTPKLRKFYEELDEENRKNLEVVWVSRDKEAPDQLEYYEKAMPAWYYIPFGDSNIAGFLEKYDVKVIPALKLVNEKGDVVDDRVRSDVEGCSKGDATKCYQKWKEMY